MGIRVALHHKTVYNYDRLVTLGPQVVRLRPAPQSRTVDHILATGLHGHLDGLQIKSQSQFQSRTPVPANVANGVH